ncbi:MAG: SDR family oxidoreductase [Planctomycetes bacterium]|nr:SDR family oxidoreductase [Planctomycetota bacterium]
MSNDEFSGKHVLITGGTRGIGKATAIRLAGEGSKVTVNYLSRTTDAEQAVAAIKEAGSDATAIAGDVSTPAGANEIVRQAREAFGPIDILVHAAGFSDPCFATDITWEQYRKTMSINCDGTFAMVMAVIEEMIERKFGRIVTVSSIAALRERENQVDYSASKAAVIAMTRCWAQAWAKHNVRVNCCCPGLTETEMAHTLTPEVHKLIIEATPIGRIGSPEELAAVIRFLASEESSFMTGQTVVASGGRVMLPG